MAEKRKKYGLILPGNNEKAAVFQPSKNIFGDDLDSDEEINKKNVLLQPSHNINRQSKITQNKTISEDPTVYQYDEIYDSMRENTKKKKISKEEKKPKYIENLLKAANKRKLEYERRIERQIQKEREKEGNEFADKEVFVTSAYKKKLEELEQEEEREKREEYLESIGDVTKQRDLGGFYRQLYTQLDKASEVLPDNMLKADGSKKENKITDSTKQRNYRKRVLSTDKKNQLSDGEIDDTDEELNRENLNKIKGNKKQKNENIDADSDFSVNDPSDDEDKEDKTTTLQNEHLLPNQSKEQSKVLNKIPENFFDEEQKEENNPILPKIDIWKKRTVGEVFDQALLRYYERKAARSR